MYSDATLQGELEAELVGTLVFVLVGAGSALGAASPVGSIRPPEQAVKGVGDKYISRRTGVVK